ncbi:DUF4097 family beta strand repeat-containing protein [Actinopolymorpha pittospori]|uniref:DUF4097 domain-containing protein n=1 Tax=Actinopolymorpha pittospori TaxID=648752 RepID=A0A927RHL3_9ACTN|nr:DUF4097 family beta strand repeat-containing protein [Actinopolymorpha pittospori]MBE1605311.1 hypothetical protein [Actinopolymorpha pittospori]
MPTFATPEPITLRLRLRSGDVIIEASDRDSTEVEVRPSNPNRSADLDAVEETLVEHHDGVIVVEARDHGPRGSDGSVHVRVALPTGSDIDGHKASADLRATGRLGTVSLNTASGDVQLEHVGPLSIKSASGDIRCQVVDGDVKVESASGDITLPEVHGSVQISSASGDIDLGQVDGDVRMQSASGDGTVRSAGGSVEVKTASGDMTIGSFHRGQASVDAASGDITIAVARGVSAWLDVSSLTGSVRSALEESDGPADSEDTVEIRARTLSGDISITRA